MKTRTNEPEIRGSGSPPTDGSIIDTDLPGRLDCLPWGRFHTLIVLALGITWLFDGL